MAIRYYRWREAFHREIWNADRHWYVLLGQLGTPRFQIGENVFVPPDALASDDDRVVVGYVVRL